MCEIASVPRFTFFVGKGGVGKTTVSSAYALYRAAQRPHSKVLLLSTDPAHSLADVLQNSLNNKPRRLRAKGELWARQIDPARQIHAFLDREGGAILALLNKGSLFTGDELEPLLDTSLPGMSELAALLAIDELLAGSYDEVVVDTAPMGHTIRLFEMPEHFARFLAVLDAAAERDVILARHFGGRVHREPALERWARLVERIEQALSAQQSRLMMVTTPEPFSLRQAARSVVAFHVAGKQHRLSAIVLNRIVKAGTKCAHCDAATQLSRAARDRAQATFPHTSLYEAEDPGSPILGIPALASFGQHIFDRAPLAKAAFAPPPVKAKAAFMPAKWPLLQTPLTMTVGKGGVGKTTISAAMAFHHRKTMKSDTVSICSIDPAPSLDDVFAVKIGDSPKAVLRDKKLLAAEFDAVAGFREWATQIRDRLDDAMTAEARGVHVDLSADRNFLLALLDIVPPGVDEIFAIFRVLELLRSGGRVVIDMAPTGHALELLRTPERLLAWSRMLMKTLAAHRELPFAADAAVEVAGLSQNVRELSALLRDRKRCRNVVVTLPEPLPDRETSRLLTAMSDLKVPLGAVFVNRVLLDVDGRCPRCKLRAQWQAASLAKLRKQIPGAKIYIAREFATAPAGAKGLRLFTDELRQLKA